MVLLHLPDKVLTGQQRVELGVGRGVYIRRQVFRQIVNAVRQQVFIQTIEQVAYHGVLILRQQGVYEGVAHGCERTDIRAVCGFEQQEGLILDFKVGKGQFGGAVLILRRGHQFVDILFEMQL